MNINILTEYENWEDLYQQIDYSNQVIYQFTNVV